MVAKGLRPDLGVESMNRLFSFCRGLLMAGALQFASLLPSAAADFELKFAHFVPPAHILHSTLWPDMIKRIEEQSNGRIKITMYPAGQLLKINEIYDGVQNGVADMGYVLFGATPGRFPSVSVAEMPFLFPNAEVGSGAIMKLAATGAFDNDFQDVKPLYFHAIDLLGIHLRDGEIRTPADIQGKRIRFGSAPAKDLLAAYGAIPVGVAAPQLYENLEKGVIDGMTAGWDSLVSLRLAEVSKSHLDMSVFTMVFGLVMSKDTLNRLPPELQKVVMDNVGMAEAQRLGRELDKVSTSGRQYVIDQGHTVPTLTDAEAKAWRDGAAPMIETYLQGLEDQGIKARENYKFLQSAAAAP